MFCFFKYMNPCWFESYNHLLNLDLPLCNTSVHTQRKKTAAMKNNKLQL